MASLKSEQWGIIAKIAYKYVIRGLLEKAVKSTSNDLDNRALGILDGLAGYPKPKTKL